MTTKAGTARTKERRRKDPEVRRTQILEAARNCFASFGFQGTSVDCIAAEAGVSVGLLYRFFKSKAAIVEAIIIEEVEAQLAQLSKAIESDALSSSELWKLAMQGLGEGSLDLKRMAMMFEISAEICRNPTLHAFVQERHVQSLALLRQELIRKGATVETAAETLRRIDAVSAIVSALGMRAVLHSDPRSSGGLDRVQELIDDVYALAFDHKRRQSAGT